MDFNGQKVNFGISGLDFNSYLYKDKINAFDCGNKALNEYLKKGALNDTINGTNNTTIFFQKDNLDKIAGYYSISAASFRLNNAYDFEIVSGLANDKDINLDSDLDFSAIKINDFAVSKDMQGQRIGTKMMLKLWYSLYLSKIVSNVGTSVMILNSLFDATEFYQNLGFRYVGRDFDAEPNFDPNKLFPMIIRFDDIVNTIEGLELPIPDNLFTFMNSFN